MRNSVPLKAFAPVRRVRTDLQHESIYSRLCSHFAVHFTNRLELRFAQGFSDALFSPWPARSDARVAHMLGCDGYVFSSLRALDLHGPLLPARFLRYCPTCMESGYHSAIFQHLAVSRCPWHGESLRETCPSCDKAIVPTVQDLRSDPYSCPHCAHALSSLHAQRHSKLPIEAVDGSFDGVRTALRTASHSITGRWDIEQWWRAGPLKVRQRHVARSLGLREPLSEELPWQFKGHETLSREAAVRYPRSRGVAPVLKWLLAECPGAAEACRLSTEVSRSGAGVRLNREASLLGVALFRTLLRFGLEKAFAKMHAFPQHDVSEEVVRAWKELRGRALFRDKEIAARVSQLELIGYLALTIAKLRRGGGLAAVDWALSLEPIEYAPCVAPGLNDTSLLVRSRADETLLQRMFNRYARSMFHSVDEHLLMQIIASERPTEAPAAQAGGIEAE